MLTNELKELARNIKEAVFDIETDALLHDYENVWCICVQDVLTRQILTFHDYPEFEGEQSHTDKEDGVTEFTIPMRDGSLTDGARFLHLAGNKEASLICHNVIGFDRVVLEQTFPKFKVPIECWHDTLLQSQIQLFDRNPVKGCKGVHGLDPWGARVGVGKPKVVDYTVMTPWLLWRCIKDIEINTKVYLALEKERKMLLEDFGLDSTVPMETEKLYAVEAVNQELTGVLMDVDHMKNCVVDLDEKIEELRVEVEPQLPLYCVYGGGASGAKETTNFIAKALGLPKIPPIKYELRERKGEMVEYAIKKWHKCTTNIFKEEKKNSYEILCKGEPTGHFSEKLKDARGLINEWVSEGANKKDYTTVKSVNTFKVPNAHMVKYWGKSEEELSSILGGIFTKVEVRRPTLSQTDKVKDYLLSLGWKPFEFNVKKDSKGKVVRDDRGQPVNTSPKLTEESFITLPEGIGQAIAKHSSYVHRRGYLENSKDDEKGLLNMVRPDGRLSAGIRTFGAATGRAAQFGIVNLPSPKALYGKEMRKSIISPEGRVLVSVDMDGSQLRLSADFAGNIEYGESLVVGIEDYTDKDGKVIYVGSDSHTLNCIGFGLATEEERDEAARTQDPELIRLMGIARGNGKNGTYAVIFGCSGKKLALMIKVEESTGEARKQAFFDKLGLTGLMKTLLEEWKQNKHGKGGYIRTLGDYFVYCQSEHKILNYFIQGAESIIQREAIIYAGQKVREEGLDADLVLSVHDEYTMESSIKDSKRVAIIMADAYALSAKKLGVTIKFGGTAKIGDSYYDVH